MQTVYYEGSTAHLYLHQHSLIQHTTDSQEQNDQVIKPMSLFQQIEQQSNLSQRETGNNEDNQQKDDENEYNSAENQYIIQMPIIHAFCRYPLLCICLTLLQVSLTAQMIQQHELEHIIHHIIANIVILYSISTINKSTSYNNTYSERVVSIIGKYRTMLGQLCHDGASLQANNIMRSIISIASHHIDIDNASLQSNGQIIDYRRICLICSKMQQYINTKYDSLVNGRNYGKNMINHMWKIIQSNIWQYRMSQVYIQLCIYYQAIIQYNSTNIQPKSTQTINYHNLYHHIILHQLSMLLAQRPSSISDCALDQQYSQQQKSRIVGILNIIRLQLVHKLNIGNSNKQPIAQHKQTQSQNNQQSIQAVRQIPHQYMVLTTHQPAESIDNQQISNDIVKLKNHLDSILHNRITNKYECQIQQAKKDDSQSVKQMQMQMQMQRRVQGFGNIFNGNGKRSHHEQYYLQ